MAAGWTSLLEGSGTCLCNCGEATAGLAVPPLSTALTRQSPQHVHTPTSVQTHACTHRDNMCAHAQMGTRRHTWARTRTGTLWTRAHSNTRKRTAKAGGRRRELLGQCLSPHPSAEVPREAEPHCPHAIRSHAPVGLPLPAALRSRGPLPGRLSAFGFCLSSASGEAPPQTL